MRTAIHRRLRQFLSAIGARIAPADLAPVEQLLPPAQQQLFLRMPIFDQRHCLDVCATLVARGCDDPLLLRAALLHDCGKVADDGRPIPLIYYGVFVLLRRLSPGLYDRAVRHGRGILRPFAIHADHDRRSAALVAATGGPPELTALLEDYGAGRESAQVLALRAADEAN
jgi:hypothetical protein